MLAGLGHGAVGSGYNQDRAVHLRSAGDHVLHVVGVARAVHVRIVTLVRLVFHVSGVDRDAAGALLRSLIDVGVIRELGIALQRQNLRDGRSQRRLAMVNVADGANVDMRLVAFKFCFRHFLFPPLFRNCSYGHCTKYILKNQVFSLGKSHHFRPEQAALSPLSSHGPP